MRFAMIFEGIDRATNVMNKIMKAEKAATNASRAGADKAMAAAEAATRANRAWAGGFDKIAAAARDASRATVSGAKSADNAMRSSLRLTNRLRSGFRTIGSGARSAFGTVGTAADKAYRGVVSGVNAAIRATMVLHDKSVALARNGFGQIRTGAGKAFRGVAIAAGLASAAFGSAALAAGSLTGTASQFEKFQTILETTEGSSAKARTAMGWVGEFAAKTPYELDQVMDSFVQLRSYGLDPTNGLLRSLGDTSAAMGKPMIQAVEAVADAVTGENERLKDFGVTASKSGNKITYSYTNAAGKMERASVKANDRLAIQTKLMEIFNEKYGGAMQKLSGTWAGMLSNVADIWSQFQLSIMNAGLFDWMKGKLAGVLDTLNAMKADGTFDAWAKRISDRIVFVLDHAWQFATRVWTIMDKLGAHLKTAADYLGGWENLGLTLAGLAFAPTLIATAAGLMQIVAGLGMIAASPAGLVIAGIAAAAWLLVDDWGAVFSWFNQKLDAFTAAFGKLKGLFRDIFANPGDALSKLFAFEWGQVIPDLAWGAFIPAILWPKLATRLVWRTLVTALGWSSYIARVPWLKAAGRLAWRLLVSPLRWFGLIGKIAWPKMAGKLAWRSLINPLNWAGLATKLSWSLLITPLRWGLRFIPVIGWAALAGELLWNLLIKPLGWDKYITGFEWKKYLPSFSWAGVLKAIEWATWVLPIKWLDIIPGFSWKGIVTGALDLGKSVLGFEWSTFIPDFSWPTLPSFSWPTIPDLKLPELPDIGKWIGTFGDKAMGAIEGVSSRIGKAWGRVKSAFSFGEASAAIDVTDPATIRAASEAAAKLATDMRSVAGIDTGPAMQKLSALDAAAKAIVPAVTSAVRQAQAFLANVSFYDQGAALIDTMAAGIRARASVAVAEIARVAQAMRDHLPSSPAKVGPLSDIHRLKFGETIAQSIRPQPMVKAMRAAALATMGAAAITAPAFAAPAVMPARFMPVQAAEPGNDAVAAAHAPDAARAEVARVGMRSDQAARGAVQAAGASGDAPITVNFSPTFQWDGQTPPADIKAQLEKELPGLARMLFDRLEEEQRRRKRTEP